MLAGLSEPHPTNFSECYAYAMTIGTTYNNARKLKYHIVGMKEGSVLWKFGSTLERQLIYKVARYQSCKSNLI